MNTITLQRRCRRLMADYCRCLSVLTSDLTPATIAEAERIMPSLVTKRHEAREIALLLRERKEEAKRRSDESPRSGSACAVAALLVLVAYLVLIYLLTT